MDGYDIMLDVEKEVNVCYIYIRVCFMIKKFVNYICFWFICIKVYWYIIDVLFNIVL